MNISLTELEEINKNLVKQFGGGGYGFKDKNLAISAIEGCNQEIFGEVLYPSILSKINHVVFAIVAYHIFIDGNKRTALNISEQLLTKYEYKYDLLEVRDYILGIARSEYNEEDSLKVLTKIVK